MQIQPQIPQAPRFTRWHNPDDRDVTLDLYVGREAGPSGRQRYIVPAKGTADIPSNLDRGIQLVQDGVVVQGLAPTLRRLGTIDIRGQLQPEAVPVVADALDPAKQKEAQEKRAVENMIKSQIAMQKAAEALGAQSAALANAGQGPAQEPAPTNPNPQHGHKDDQNRGKR